ncbi:MULTISPECIES: DNA repair protein RecO [unclassified Gilliamella]|uniref:DNA repair protein RecO n=1 Tax=unclassified Gilliamella TaxID=2685620 RepID=UPI001C6A0ADA|nr:MULTISPECIES: DNA repair protein RecO [unclassified Gilliamella]MCX8601387.1 DNA repair protein RecO [Gilliamella sp. B3722]MCX8608968.1 DNA repair protein RecO [Gilliamella sp. B3771]MCX8610643.1 DNA repair protein RecO [Gilliamella sp. B3891]MCX8613118.1 DNA repair protein RecO [Gilliamella sp. B3773]MCX8615385.1 DNA repair protein RecO [Gilliamella sp. B3770]
MENWQRAFVLHTRTYSESSLLVDLFVENVGKITILAKGARRKKSSLKGILQPFTPLIVQYSGHGEIKNLRQVEAISLTLPLVSIWLYSAFYLNELLHRVLVAETEMTTLFDDYLKSIQQLAQQTPAEKVLRVFELALLENLGYHVDFFHCSVTGDEIVESMSYQYQSEKGFISSLMQNSTSFTGKQVLALGHRQFDDEDTLKAAKRFTRMAMKPYVGSKPFKSRELFLKI